MLVYYGSLLTLKILSRFFSILRSQNTVLSERTHRVSLLYVLPVPLDRLNRSVSDVRSLQQ